MQALSLLHKLGIGHGDVRFENFISFPENDGDGHSSPESARFWLIDFGLAVKKSEVVAADVAQLANILCAALELGQVTGLPPLLPNLTRSFSARFDSQLGLASSTNAVCCVF